MGKTKRCRPGLAPRQVCGPLPVLSTGITGIPRAFASISGNRLLFAGRTPTITRAVRFVGLHFCPLKGATRPGRLARTNAGLWISN